jgi:hemerythrin
MYKFTDDCKTGISSIDSEHEKLFSMINEGIKLLGEKNNTAYAAVKELIAALKKYAEEHFANEEAYMEKIHDCELERQKKEHEAFTKYVNQFDLEKLDDSNASQKLDEILTYLSEWLFRHILASDIMIGHNLNPQEESVFEFTDKYRTGIKLVDDEHKRLFEIIKQANDLISAELLHDKYDAIVDILNELKDYTITHFSDEEKYMEEINYKGLAAQKVAHEAFVERLEQVDLEHVDDNQQEYLNELVEYLISWLSLHIMRMDKKIPVK